MQIFPWHQELQTTIDRWREGSTKSSFQEEKEEGCQVRGRFSVRWVQVQLWMSSHTLYLWIFIYTYVVCINGWQEEKKAKERERVNGRTWTKHIDIPWWHEWFVPLFWCQWMIGRNVKERLLADDSASYRLEMEWKKNSRINMLSTNLKHHPSQHSWLNIHVAMHERFWINMHVVQGLLLFYHACSNRHVQSSCSPYAGIDLVGESTGTAEVKDEGSLKDICTCMWFILKLFQELVPGEVDDNECNFEEQLLEELLQHFETGVGNPTFIDDLHSWKDKLWINVAKADSARSCISACRITSKLQHPTGRAELNVCQKHICLCWLVDKTSNDLPRLVQCFDANCKLAEPSTLVTQPTCFDMSLELVFANFNW